MSANDLLQMIRRRPFMPFRLVTTDGTTYEIRHPEMLMPGLSAVTIGVPNDPAVPIYGHLAIVSMRHVQRLEVLTAPAQTGNGETDG